MFNIIKSLVSKHSNLEYLHFDRDDWWGNRNYEIDPFSIFAMFNRNLKDETRIEIAKLLSEALNFNETLPTDFAGIPLMNNQNAFYSGVDEIWELYEQAIKCSKTNIFTEEFNSAFEASIEAKGNGLATITMGLFLIRPNTYLNIDGQNKSFIINNSAMSSVLNIFPDLKNDKVPKGFQYINMCSECKKLFATKKYEFNSFPELSFYACQNKPKDIFAKKYWLFAPGQNASQWDNFYNNGIIGIGWEDLGNLAQYATKEDIKLALRELTGENISYMNDSLALWQFANDISVGDIIIVKQGLSVILGRGVVESDYFYDDKRSEYNHVRNVKWTNKGEFQHPGKAVQKTLTDITPYTEYVQKIERLFNENFEIEIDEDGPINFDQYTKENFLADVYMSESDYDTLENLLHRKKNIILQGAPGVGKSYAANRLAFSLMGEKDTKRVQLIQFHQSYSYEDFIMGYRPDKDGFNLVNGVFYEFCKKAQDDDENDYYFIIDEINRGNLSKIFGELFMLIEHDKRDRHNSLRLLYSNEQFYIPSNVYIIGMMNTADRSLAMLDYALRRRFAFFEINPAFDSDGFKAYQTKIANEKYNKLINQIKSLNKKIEADETLGAGFRIGHSYFITDDNIDDAWIKAVVNYEIIPLLKEYWFDEPTKVNDWINLLNGAIL